MSNESKYVLCVGVLCVDLIYICDQYLEEDKKMRASRHHWQKGGNAANAACMLANLGTNAEFMGTFLDITKTKPDILGPYATAHFALSELERAGVRHTNLAFRNVNHFPTSSAIINKQSGTRSVIHCRGPLDELKNEDFVDLDLSQYRWIHFEGRRNVEVIRNQMELVVERNKTINREEDKIILSVELERPKIEGLLNLCSLADLVIIGKEYASHFGYKSPLDVVSQYKHKLKPRAEIVCPWSNLGAAYVRNYKDDDDADLVPAVDVDQIVDTLGAGDTFLASLIHAKLNGLSLKKSVRYACRIAAEKIQNYGYDCTKGLGLGSTEHNGC